MNAPIGNLQAQGRQMDLLVIILFALPIKFTLDIEDCSTTSKVFRFRLLEKIKG